jgi:hypothetical protein
MNEEPSLIADNILLALQESEIDVSTAATGLALAYVSICKGAGVFEDDAVSFLRTVYNAIHETATH